MYSVVVSDELRFLITLCSLDRSQVGEYISQLGGLKQLDDSLIFHLSERHRVTPLVWSITREFDIFPEDVRQRFEFAFRQNQMKSLRAKANQIQLQKLLDESSQKGLFLKGIGIADRYYDDIAERHVLDIDLYVNEDGLNNMILGLKELGYLPQPDVTKFNSSQFDFFRSTHHDIYFAVDEANDFLPVELHWRIHGQWAGFKITPETGFSTIDEFLYLCVHGTEHGWFRMKWLVDIPRVIKKAEFDWTMVWERAIQLGCINHFAITLLVLEDLRMYPLPVVLSNLISRTKYKTQLNYIFQALISESHFNESDGKRWEYLKYQFSLSNHKSLLPFLKKIMTSPQDWKVVRLPQKLFFLYFLLRPFLWCYRRILK